MAEATQSTTSTTKDKKANLTVEQKRNLRKKKKLEGRKKRTLKLRTDKEFAKQYFEAKSKRSIDKSSAYRKKKSSKK